MKKPSGKGRWLAVAIAVIIVVIFAARFTGGETKPQEHQPGSVSTEEHSTQEPTEAESASVELTAEEWKTILLKALDCEGAEAELTMYSDGSMTLEGDLPKSTINSWLESGDVELSSMYQTIFDMLPDTVPMTLEGTVSCNDGDLTLSGSALYVSQIELSEDMLSDSVWEQINTTLNEEVHSRISQVSDFRFEGETVVLESGT